MRDIVARKGLLLTLFSIGLLFLCTTGWSEGSKGVRIKIDTSSGEAIHEPWYEKKGFGLFATYNVVSDDNLLTKTETVASSIIKAVPNLKSTNLYFVIVDSKEMGAVTDGNTVYIAKKAFQKLSEKALAYLIAHEVAHIKLEHEPHWFGSPSSRQQETDADLEGLKYLKKAHYDTQGALDLMRAFVDEDANKTWYQTKWSLLLYQMGLHDHPLTQERYDYLRAEIAKEHGKKALSELSEMFTSQVLGASTSKIPDTDTLTGRNQTGVTQNLKPQRVSFTETFSGLYSITADGHKSKAGTIAISNMTGQRNGVYPMSLKQSVIGRMEITGNGVWVGTTKNMPIVGIISGTCTAIAGQTIKSNANYIMTRTEWPKTSRTAQGTLTIQPNGKSSGVFTGSYADTSTYKLLYNAQQR